MGLSFLISLIKRFRVKPASLLWGSHRFELGLRNIIFQELEEKTERPFTSLTDPVVPGIVHSVALKERRTFVLDRVRFDSNLGYLWFQNQPILESNPSPKRENLPKYVIPFHFGKTLGEVTNPLYPIRPEGYYHWLIETVPRILRAIKLVPGTRLVFFEDLFPFQEAQLRLLGLSGRLVFEQNKWRPLTVVCPTPGTESGWPELSDLSALRSAFGSIGRAPSLAKNLLIARSGYSRSILELAELSQVIKEFSLTPFEPELHSPEEQIQAFKNASLIVAEHGGALANLAFSEPGTVVVEIMRNDYANPCYEILSMQLGLDYRRVMASEARVHPQVIRAALAESKN